MKIKSSVILFLIKHQHKSEVSQRRRSTVTLNMFKTDIPIPVNIIITFNVYPTVNALGFSSTLS